jgi:hypothetical protein
MKLDKAGILMVGAAALALYVVVRKSTGATGAAATGGQSAVGSGAGSFWGNVINNLGGSPVATTGANSIGLSMPGGVTLFGNGTFDAGGIYVDPGQVTYNTQTGAVQESPFSGMYGILSPATYGF